MAYIFLLLAQLSQNQYIEFVCQIGKIHQLHKHDSED